MLLTWLSTQYIFTVVFRSICSAVLKWHCIHVHIIGMYVSNTLSLSMQVKELLDPEVARDITEQARNIAMD